MLTLFKLLAKKDPKKAKQLLREFEKSAKKMKKASDTLRK